MIDWWQLAERMEAIQKRASPNQGHDKAGAIKYIDNLIQKIYSKSSFKNWESNIQDAILGNKFVPVIMLR